MQQQPQPKRAATMELGKGEGEAKHAEGTKGSARLELTSLPPECIDAVVFLLVACEERVCDGGKESHERTLRCVRGANRALRSAASLRMVARGCLSQPQRFTKLLRAGMRVPLMGYLRLSGGYKAA
eukprot:CAMPEP_0173458054 /NCGR_PEP_ID=MMETSP1357-20121228/58855_1 /TAXON_ID=77926 /ORGANISM="Hemiselmis rufescens, Strain PCC563" /LENGTH=125 /DNA_ID=CAMNT_0014425393 /DNA_START=163 /DNA_END=536 /DNA_ORIENTATION=-